MRILHTADWHIGQTLNGWTRDVEHGRFLSLLADLVETYEVDALIVAGDIFDGINPSADSLSLFYRSLAACRRRRPALTTIVVAGNHDPAGRLEAPDVVLREIGVHVAGTLRRVDGKIDPERHLAPLRDATGAIRAHVLAIPYLRAADLPGLSFAPDPDAGSPVIEATRRLYEEAVAMARPLTGGAPLLATGHLHCAGALESEGAERRILVGGEHAVPHDVFPDELAYVALGHLHKAQKIGRDCIRYSGSPFPLSATELGYDHGVRLIEIGESGLRSEHIRLARPVPCIRLPESGGMALAALAPALETLGLDAATPMDSQPFVHIVVAPEGPIGGLEAEVERIVAEHPVRCAGVKILRPVSAATEVATPALVPLAERTPLDLFEQVFEERFGEKPDAEHRAAFLELESEA